MTNTITKKLPKTIVMFHHLFVVWKSETKEKKRRVGLQIEKGLKVINFFQKVLCFCLLFYFTSELCSMFHHTIGNRIVPCQLLMFMSSVRGCIHHSHFVLQEKKLCTCHSFFWKGNFFLLADTCTLYPVSY